MDRVLRRLSRHRLGATVDVGAWTLPDCVEALRRFCSSSQQRITSVAVAGAPNAGKSTLVNALTGRKVSATSGKTNTTFRTQMGYFQEGQVQVVLYDTPGLIERGQYRDQKHGERVESAWGMAGRCDLALLVMDAYRQYVRPDPRVVALVETFQETVAEKHAEHRKHVGQEQDGLDSLPRTSIIFTKIDKLLAHDVDFGRMRDDLHRMSGVDDVFCVSGLRGNGVEDLRRFMCDISRESPWIVDKDAYEEMYGSSIVKEVIREKVFRAYYKEIPYAVNITVKEVTENERGVWVRASLSVPSASMRTIVVGSKGRAIGSVERAVCSELGRIFGKEVRCVIGVTVG